jgi:EmrB/QacA subfamily drug resistance transporter
VTTAPRVRPIFASLMLVMLLSALDSTIVATALPTIAGDLGGISKLPWIVTAYLLASTITTPIAGKLGDTFGRKTVLQTALVIFLVGSALCGLAQNMSELIVFRGVQGLGGGALLVSTQATVGDIIAPRDRGRYGGLMGSVFAISTVIGPLVGGLIVEHVSWRWIFYVNLPIGIVVFVVLQTVLHLPTRHARRAIDYVGTGLLSGALVAIVLYTSLGGTTYPWASPSMLALLALSIALAVLFVLWERRAAEPLLPLRLFRNRVFRIACAVGFAAGMSLYGALTYIPLYLQVVKGASPTSSGLQLLPLMAGITVASLTSGRLTVRFGRYKVFPIVGTGLCLTGMLLLSRLATGTSTVAVDVYMAVVGLGLGLVLPMLVLAVQNAIDYRSLGVATSTTTLFRAMGGTIGVPIFGAIFTNSLATHIASRLPPDEIARLPSRLRPSQIDALPAAIRDPYLAAWAAALRPMFLIAGALAAVGFVLAWFLDEVPLRETIAPEGLGEGFAPPRDATSLDELEILLSNLTREHNRHLVYRRLAQHAGVHVSATGAWLLLRLRRGDALGLEPGTLDQMLDELRGASLVERGAPKLTADGRAAADRLAEAGRAEFWAIVDDWKPEERPEVRRLIEGFASAMTSAPPVAAHSAR